MPELGSPERASHIRARLLCTRQGAERNTVSGEFWVGFYYGISAVAAVICVVALWATNRRIQQWLREHPKDDKADSAGVALDREGKSND